MHKFKKRNKDILCLCFLTLVVLLLFRKFVLSDFNLYGDDFVTYFYPLKKFIRDHLLEHGDIPLWNPYQFSGVPVISNIQASLFYPLGFLYYIFPPETAYGYSTAMHCTLGAIFMYGFMRTIPLSHAGSLFSAVVFIFNGYLMGHLYAGHLTLVQNYIWIPLIFLLMYRFIRTKQMRYAALSGMVLGIQILGGFPQCAFYTILGVILLCTYFSLTLKENRSIHGLLKNGFAFFVFAGVGFAIASVQMLPTLEFLPLSTRGGGIHFDFASYASLSPKQIIALLIPYVFGSPFDQTYWVSTEIWRYWEYGGYVGILPLFFIFIKTDNPMIRGLRIFFVVLLIISLFLALGNHTPLYGLIYRLPGFNTFRIPARALFLYVFSVAVLSGIGLHALKERADRSSKMFFLFFLTAAILLSIFKVGLSSSPYHLFRNLFRFFSEGSVMHANLPELLKGITQSTNKSCMLFLCSFLLLWSFKRQYVRQWTFHILVFLILMLDLYPFSTKFIMYYTYDTSKEKQSLIEMLKGSPLQGRVIVKSDLFLANDGLLYQFPSTQGYDPSIMSKYVDFIQSSQNQTYDEMTVVIDDIVHSEARLLRLLNVKKMVLGNRIYELDNEFPYAYIVGFSLRRPLEDILPFMNSHLFNPKKMVIFENGDSKKSSLDQDSGLFRGTCSVIESGPEHIRFMTDANQDGYLVVSEIFYPGWRATVDGRRVEVMCGNYLFRVVPIERGTHDVHLFYVSWPLRIGAMISLLTLLVTIVFVIRSGFKKRGAFYSKEGQEAVLGWKK